MREAGAKKLYAAITNVRDEFVEEAQAVKLNQGQEVRPKQTLKLNRGQTVRRHGEQTAGLNQGQTVTRNRREAAWLKRCVPVLVSALCLVLALGTGRRLLSEQADRNGGQGNGCSFWGSGDSSLLEERREEFTPEFSEEAEAVFDGVPGVMKVYRTLDNQWFLAEDMLDFSQVLTGETIYVVPGSGRGIDGPKEDGAYAVYTLDENGMPQWGASVYGGDMVPSQFNGLTYDIIEEDLAGIDYEDYIITQSTRLYTVFVWARCREGGDMFITYPARPEFLGLENRGRYTLEELRYILAEAYRDSEDEQWAGRY
ncbi:MAG: hypothetical protein HFH88_15605 [Lachnospiraceae bacterium]|nr:hypothetical protein [Lachnospiraceae bacterium]